MLRLKCVAQNYDWGVKGDFSVVGRLYAIGNNCTAGADTPFAELWMGTHPSGPSQVVVEEEGHEILLRDWLKKSSDALGDSVYKKWNGELPFLFKVLSVAKALSIQAHPDKKLAEALHASQPGNYKDDNHKPEMAIAVTQFDTLCGFVTTEELVTSFDTIPELRETVGDEAAQAVADMSKQDPSTSQQSLKLAFKALMTRDSSVVKSRLECLIKRLEKEQKERTLNPKENLLMKLNEQYPGDVGVFSALFLNYMTLAPGEAIYLAANEPHAYLSGECIECMAASDNVVRAGLTPKYRDTDTLCTMLTYKQGLPEVLKGDEVDAYTLKYTPPFEEFEVFRTGIPIGESYKLPVNPGPSIVLVFKGNGAASSVYKGQSNFCAVKTGDVFFLPATAEVEISAIIETDLEVAEQPAALELFRATVNSSSLL